MKIIEEGLIMEKKRQAIVMLGLPASGKGTQADILSSKINAEIVGVGDLVRQAIKSGDKNNPTIKKIIENYNKGIPQSDEIAKELLEEKLSQSKKSIIFDNYPFSKQQINDFEQMIKTYDFSSPKIIYIKINPQSSIERITKRLVCNKCKRIYLQGNIGDLCQTTGCKGLLEKRPDDTKEVMTERIKFAQPRINLVLEYFKKQGNVYEIDGERSISMVEKEIENIL